MLTLSPQWLAVLISLVVMVGGTFVNLFIIGRFVGQWSEAMRNLASSMASVQKEVKELNEVSDDQARTVGILDQRLLVVEAATKRFDSMRDEFIAMKTTVEMTGKRTEEQLAVLGRSFHGIERQLGNLMKTRPALMLKDQGDDEG